MLAHDSHTSLSPFPSSQLPRAGTIPVRQVQMLASAASSADYRLALLPMTRLVSHCPMLVGGRDAYRIASFLRSRGACPAAVLQNAFMKDECEQHAARPHLHGTCTFQRIRMVRHDIETFMLASCMHELGNNSAIRQAQSSSSTHFIPLLL